MNRSSNSNGIIGQLRLVFSISIVLLVVSLFASFLSTRKLIETSRWVNHTNEVLIESENIISFMKDGETGQRGYLLTFDPAFLEPYNAAYEKVFSSIKKVGDLTIDNPMQQKNIEEIKILAGNKFNQMQLVIDVSKKNKLIGGDTSAMYNALVKGRKAMFALQSAVERVKDREKKLLEERLEEQKKYINASPILLLLASLISILITAFAYFKIKKELDQRVAQQKAIEEKFLETSARIAGTENITKQIADGNYSVRSNDVADDELGRISKALNKMSAALETAFAELNDTAWLQEGDAKINNAISGVRQVDELCSTLISCVVEHVNAPIGTFYVADHDFSCYRLKGSFGTSQSQLTVNNNEGLLGQAATGKKMLVINDIPASYITVSSSLGEAVPTSLVLLPLMLLGECLGILEIGFLRRPTLLELKFLGANLSAMAVGLNSVLNYNRMKNLLEETQTQSEELKTQHSELENMNAEMEAHAEQLQVSEEELRVQQEELQQTNHELEEGSILLKEKNIEVQRKSDELETATRYKSEFLANMSHELRTPLNSILLLSRLLAENTDKNLNAEEIEYAQVVHSSGQGLLGMIDEILDLSRIEAGKMTIEYAPVNIGEITDEMNGLFRAIATEKKIEFKIEVDPATPPAIETDKVRVEQVIKNLISNAIKFTSKGGVTLRIAKHSADLISFAVTDTGIGIAADKQKLIFEAFQQADGSTKRKYGGTGLGLSISRELSKLLGGEITVSSGVDEGSCFTFFLPLSSRHAMEVRPEELPAPVTQPVVEVEQDKYHSKTIPGNIPDDRELILQNDKVILIIEDDTNFAKTLLDYTRKKGYKGIVAVRGDEGIELARKFKPRGILLDVELPVKSGFEVIDQLKKDPASRHIPVHMMSSHELKNESLLKGAVDFINKPMAFEQMPGMFNKIESILGRKAKKVLIIEDNLKHAQALAYYLETFNVNSEVRASVNEGVAALRNNEIDCVILDMGIPDAKSYEILEQAKKQPGMRSLPIIVFTGKSLSKTEEQKIRKYADTIVVKTAPSFQRVMDEISLFLHLVEDHLEVAPNKQHAKKLGALAEVLNNKTVLVVDDDVRNIFSISKSLEKFKMNVVTAVDGKEALETLAANPQIDIVLLDMMMPRMDGYEMAKAIRENTKWNKLPVIAVTAKAMSGDRDKCIKAGASDYITKPVDLDQLISLLRVWLYEKIKN